MGAAGSCSSGEFCFLYIYRSVRNSALNTVSSITGKVVQQEIPTFKVVLVGKLCKVGLQPWSSISLGPICLKNACKLVVFREDMTASIKVSLQLGSEMKRSWFSLKFQVCLRPTAMGYSPF